MCQRLTERKAADSKEECWTDQWEMTHSLWTGTVEILQDVSKGLPLTGICKAHLFIFYFNSLDSSVPLVSPQLVFSPTARCPSEWPIFYLDHYSRALLLFAQDQVLQSLQIPSLSLLLIE